MSDESLRVEADALLDAGDLRGELIQVQLELAALDDSDDARFVLEGRALQLLSLLRPQLRFEGRPARGEIFYRRGVAAELVLHEVAWEERDALVASVVARAPSCRGLTLYDARSWEGVGALAAALPSLVSFDVRDRYPTISGGDIQTVLDARGAQLEELAVEVHPWSSFALTRAFRKAELPRLRRLALSGSSESVGLVLAVDGKLPALTALEVSGAISDDLVAPLLAIARPPLSMIGLHRPRLEGASGLLELVAAAPNTALREVAVSSRFTLDEICRFVAAPAAARLERLHLDGECDAGGGGASVSAIATPVESLVLETMGGGVVEELVRRVQAPRLRRLELHRPTSAMLQSAWLDGVEELTLRGRVDASTIRTGPRRATRLRTLTLAVDGHGSAALVDHLELSSLRRLEIRATSLYGVDAGDLDAFRRMDAPRVRALRLVGAIGDGVLEALAAWPTAPSLRLLELVTTAELSGRAVDFLVEEKHFASLTTLALGPWTKVDPDHLPRLAARFGPGLTRLH